MIFDVDGTLVNSNDAHAAAWQDVLREHDITRDFTSIRRLIGMGGDKLLPALTGISPDSELGRRIVARRAQRFHDHYLTQLRPFPGVRALFLRIARDGFRIGIASSAKKDELDRLLAIAGVADLVQRQTSSDDVDASKPDPDAIPRRPGQARRPAARRDDGRRYAVRRRSRGARRGPRHRRPVWGWSDTDLAGARAIYDDPADLLARYTPEVFGSTPDVHVDIG